MEKPRKGGGFADEDELQIYLNRIGNRTLLSPTPNSSLGNMSFHDKQTKEEHGFDSQAESWHVTKDITSQKLTVWGPSQVEQRSRTLIGKMIEIYENNFLD